MATYVSLSLIISLSLSLSLLERNNPEDKDENKRDEIN